MSLLEAVSPTSRRLLTPSRTFNRASDVPRRTIQTAARYVREAQCEEDCLRYLGQLLGNLSVEILYPHGEGTRDVLQRLFALAVCWVARLRGTDQFQMILGAVHAERVRQEELRRARPDKYPFALSSTIPDARRKLRVIFEECGEVAAALDELECGKAKTAAREHLIEELIQCAACAEAWLEAYEVAS